MIDLLEGIMDHFSGSDLAELVGDRLFEGEAPPGAEFPYMTFFIVGASPDKTFSEEFIDTMIQFDIFSAATGVTEIGDIYKELKALFDEQEFTIAGSALIWMKLVNLATFREEITTGNQPPATAGQTSVRQWSIDFEIKTLTT
jgi:hypothetical protein